MINEQDILLQEQSEQQMPEEKMIQQPIPEPIIRDDIIYNRNPTSDIMIGEKDIIQPNRIDLVKRQQRESIIKQDKPQIEFRLGVGFKETPEDNIFKFRKGLKRRFKITARPNKDGLRKCTLKYYKVGDNNYVTPIDSMKLTKIVPDGDNIYNIEFHGVKKGDKSETVIKRKVQFDPTTTTSKMIKNIETIKDNCDFIDGGIPMARQVAMLDEQPISEEELKEIPFAEPVNIPLDGGKKTRSRKSKNTKKSKNTRKHHKKQQKTLRKNTNTRKRKVMKKRKTMKR